MTQSEYTFGSITEVADLIRRRDISSLELVESILARIEDVGPRLNCYITVLESGARQRAQILDTLLREGTYLGPLHGIPLSLKDNIQTAGIRTTGGSARLLDWVPTTDATVVRKLLQAGAVLIAKAGLYEFAYSDPHPRFGPTRNPWNLERTCSGSSSGSAAAVAAGLCHGSIGTDTGGSIRGPAALCGIVGLRPTYGLVSRAGVIPLSPTLDAVGPLARSIDDAAILLRAMAGPDPLDPTTVKKPPETALRDAGMLPKGVRVGVPRPQASLRVHPDVQRAFQSVLEVLEGQGFTLVDVSLPDYEFAGTVWRTILAPEASEYHRADVRDHPEDYHPNVLTWLKLGELIPATAYVHAQRVRQQIIAELRTAFQQVDIIVTLAYPIPAYGINATHVAVDGHELSLDELHHTIPTKLFSLTGQPALVMPCGFSTDGLPIGFQIVARPFHESILFDVARAYERITDWHLRHPL